VYFDATNGTLENMSNEQTSRIISTREELNELTDGATIATLIQGEPVGRVWGKLEGQWWGMALECSDTPVVPAMVLREGK